jgi:hypothetical protein
MGYIIWTIEDGEPRIGDIKNELPSRPIIGQSHRFIHSFGQFEALVGKKKADMALTRYYAGRRPHEGKTRNASIRREML